MTDTQKRIAAYQAALPGLKEKVAAVALLLVMSVVMMTSATFAWLTISRRPELSGVTTNLASNGNLEIALASGNGETPPGDSQVGDSSATEGQSISDANLTWGNLINLSDPSYGLDHLALRPAQLNTAALLTKPLYGAVYDTDGRIKNLTTNYGYTAWIPAEGNKPARFGVSDDLGVRAISSIKREQVGYSADYSDMVEAADIANVTAKNTYTDITIPEKHDGWMDVLAKLLGIHMTATLNYEDKYINATIEPGDMTTLIAMYEEFILAHEQEADAIAKQLNLELFAAYGGDTTKYTPFAQADILTINPNSDSRIQSNGDFAFDILDSSNKSKTIKITNLKTFLKDYAMLQSDLAKLQAIDAAKDYRWTASGLKDVIANLMNVDQCLIKKQNESTFKTVKALMNEFNSDVSAAMGYMGEKCDIVITNGVLYNLEQRVGSSISIKNMEITAYMYVAKLSREFDAQVYAYVTTSASKPGDFYTDLAYVDETLNTGADTSSGDALAEDTYALAVDFWVRTNSMGSFLTLEGNVLLGDPYEVPIMTEDDNGEMVPLYSLSRSYQDETTGERTMIQWDVYKKEINGTATWYVANSHRELTAEDLGDAVPVALVEEKRDVIGYEGENRVWDKDNKQHLLPENTTQGVGSCYVYYADSPEDQARSLDLLKAMNVAFVDGSGALLATASMDTEHYYANSGRVVVPLVMNNDGIMLKSTDENGEEVITYAITSLQQNTPTRITAIVYLDGTILNNENVLAAADIQGQLNIQFGNNATMQPIDNEKLEYETRKVSATVDNTTFDYDTHDGDMVSNVTIHVDGDEPTNVTAFFQRKINSTQGSREKEMTFTKSGSDWVASHTFLLPGEYILRTVSLDGMEYILAEPLTVKINGFTIASLTCDEAEDNHVGIMTEANSAALNLNLKFASDDATKLPSTVQGRFLNNEDGSAVSVDFTYNATTQLWSGKANFLNSGEYTMQYLVLNGQYVELDADNWITADIKLGMKVAVYTSSITSFKFIPSEMAENGTDQLHMQVKILDNSGKELSGLENVKLTYRLYRSASTVDADLDWNPVSRYYEGDIQALEAGPGNWVFEKVSIGEANTITNDTVSPVFEIKSPEPPSLEDGFTGATTQYSPSGEAMMTAYLKYSNTATVAAVFTDANGKHYPVMGTMGTTDQNNITTWTFTLPKNATGEYSGKQDGYWTMQDIYVWNYYMADGTYVKWDKDEQGKLVGELVVNSDGTLATNGSRDDANVMHFDVSDKNLTAKVVQTITVTFAPNQSKNFGKDASGNVTGIFMQSYEGTNGISGVYATVKDFTGPVDGAGDIIITYDYAGDAKAKGGYEGDTTVGKTEVFTLTLKQDATDKTKFVQSGSQNVQLAGTYMPSKFTFTFTQASQTHTVSYEGETMPANAPTYTVWSKIPSVKITDAWYKSGEKDAAAEKSTFTDTETTVYMMWTKETACGVEYKNYQPAKVTLTLSGYGNATGANLEFTTNNSDGKVHLYPEGQQDDGTATNAYTWSKDGTCLRYMGWWESKTGSDEKAAAGTLTATKLTLTYGTLTYYVDISDIKISNPS